MSIQTRISQFLAFLGRSLVWSLHLGVFFYTLLIYYLIGQLPVEHWVASMLMITLPIAWLMLIVLGLIWLFTRPWRSTLSVLGLLLGYWLYPRTFGLHTPTDPPAGSTPFSLLSYNVSVFELDDYYDDSLHREPRETRLLTDWVLKHPAPIKCFQEFYDGPQAPAFQMIDRLTQAGYTHHVLLRPPTTSYTGVATFSRYPIVAHGEQSFNSFNGLIWTDIQVGSDTIRVINVHLQSMGIRVRKVLQEREMAGVKAETRSVLEALKFGFKSRLGEVQQVEELVAQSPHPVIVTGDCNDTPYSVVYERLHRRLTNAFEVAGHGFGFTLNRAPKTIRIDNQFFDSDRLQMLNFLTLRDQPYSDHFPIEGHYVLRKTKE